MKKDCETGTCYHCKSELKTKNKKFCPEHFEVYKELFNEFQEFYENNNEKIRITRIKHFKASTRRYIRDYLNDGYVGIPVSYYMDLNDLTEAYFEKIYTVIHKDDLINFGFETNRLALYHGMPVDIIKSLGVQRKIDQWNSMSNFEKFNKPKF